MKLKCFHDLRRCLCYALFILVLLYNISSDFYDYILYTEFTAAGVDPGFLRGEWGGGAGACSDGRF